MIEKQPREADMAGKARADVERRVRWLPPDFSLAKASRDQLYRLGLLPPEAGLATEWEVLRNRVMDTKPAYVSAAFRFDTPFRLNKLRQGLGGVRSGSSRNWSGGCLLPNGGERFQQVVAVWQVPDAAAPPVPGGGNPPDGEYACSTWVGLDGYRRFAGSLPQLGTGQNLTVAGGVGTVKQYAWYQWWVRNEDFGPVLISGMPIAKGDFFLCMVNVISPEEVWFLMLNLSQNAFTAFGMEAPAPDAPVRGTTAEWVTERPTKLNSNVLHLLPDYARVPFEPCMARSAPDPSSAGRWRSLTGARVIRMTEQRGKPYRSVVISRARKLGARQLETSFRATP
ncbi:MAG TPA: G1 family glutamic endopeptidase [Roseomonas sp.]